MLSSFFIIGGILIGGGGGLPGPPPGHAYVFRGQFLNSLQWAVGPSRTRSDNIARHTLEK